MDEADALRIIQAKAKETQGVYAARLAAASKPPMDEAALLARKAADEHRRSALAVEQKLKADHDKRTKFERLMRKAGIRKKYEAIPFEPDTKDLPVNVRGPYLAAFERLKRLEWTQAGAIAALLGGRGAGKTWMANCIIKRFCRDGRSAMYRRVYDYFQDLKCTFGSSERNQQNVMDFYEAPALLVLDGLEEKAETAWHQQSLTALLDARYMDEKLTILISNDTEDSLNVRVGASIESRINDGGGIIFCDWPDLRKSGLAK